MASAARGYLANVWHLGENHIRLSMKKLNHLVWRLWLSASEEMASAYPASVWRINQ
jgi:hypothetical protein